MFGRFDYDYLNWKVQTKLDQDTHDEIEEWANKCTRGNISACVRDLISMGLEQARAAHREDAPKLVRMLASRRAWLEKERAIERTRLAMIELDKRYDPVYEMRIKEYAQEQGVPWPPDEFEIQHVDPDLQKVMDRLTKLIAEDGSASLRDVYRGIGGMDAGKAKETVFKLRDMGLVVVTETDQNSVKIEWLQAQ